MKLKRFGIIFTIMLMIVVLAVSSYNYAYAESTDNNLYLGLQLYRQSGCGYTIGDGELQTGNTDIVWKIVSYENESSTENPKYDKNIYCLDAGKGFNNIDQNKHSSEIKTYTYNANMYDANKKQEIMQKWNENKHHKDDKSPTNIDEKTYNKILWIIDNMYVPTGDKETDEKLKEELYSKVNCHPVNPHYGMLDDEIEKGTCADLNDEQLEVVGQLAIWYFTNAEEDKTYHTTTKTFSLHEVTKDGENQEQCEDCAQGIKDSAQAIYKYLVNEAENQGEYTHQEDENALVKTTATFWADDQNTNQPVVVIEKTPNKEFDLSLRKRVTQIKKEDGTVINLAVERKYASNSEAFYAGENDATTQIRNINIDTSKLNKNDESGAKVTTAEYKHRKDPVTVDTGDKVTYTITIYNEGSIDGRATEITDQLPAGLKFDEEETRKLNNDKYNYTYDNNKNEIKISEKEAKEENNLKAYANNNTLSSTEIYIVCDVEQERQEDKETILTNIAWISKDSAADSSIQDRDSRPGIEQSKSKDDLNTTDVGYTGKTNYDSRDDLANADKYYEGQQDDDDFDKLVLPSKEKIFDLSLRKYITKVTSADGTVVTDIENSSSKRNPVVDTSTLKTGTTANYKHRKDPVIVNAGDLVTYNITVYNEGEKNGRATKIVDQLPAGLEFNRQETEKITENSGYTFEYDETNNKVTISEKDGVKHEDLVAYSGEGELSSNTIQVVCNVTEEKGTTEKILTNIAYISEEYNADDDETITSQRYPLEKEADRDSQPANSPSKNQNELNTGSVGYTGKNNYTASQLADPDKYFEGQQDDDDFEKVKLLPDQIDLALRKFITSINSKGVEREITSRIPQVDTSTIKTNGTATYNHTKEPINVQIGDIVTYTIRVYNEGGLDGYVSEITDHLPEYLEYITSAKAETEAEKAAAKFNEDYLWEVSVDGRTITTTLTAQDKSSTYSTHTGIERENTLLKAYDGGEELDYIDVKVKCKVKKVEKATKITNIAEITGMQDKNGLDVETDRDSTKDNVKLPTDDELPNYKDDESNKPYVPGQEDDDDFEKLIVQIFDLALRKFITAVDDEAVTTRYPQVSYNEEKEKLEYTHPKDPVGVSTNNLVTYTIRVFNEGEIDGYAKEVTDNLPEGLLYLPENKVNEKYRWKMIDKDGNETENVEEAVYITTDYLSKAQEDEAGRDNLLKAFDKEKGVTDTNPDYRDLKVVFEVIEPNTSDRILTNVAQISEDEDKDGNEIDDVDSIPNNDEKYDFENEDENEDDIDYEKVKLKYFDLALRKFITAVDNTSVNNRVPQLSLDENGKIKYEHTKVPVDVENGNIVTYTIRIFNEGNTDGYADEVTDDMPEGLEFLPDNDTNKEYRWKMIDKDGNQTDDISKAVKITTDYLSIAQEEETGRDNLIKAFDKELGLTDTNPDYRDVKVAFKVTEPNTSNRILVNTAEISEDKDENGKPVEDIDSTPGNNEDGEDDIDKEYVKVKYFDLALKKWVTQAIVIENGKQTVTQTGHTGDENPEPPVKVEIKEKSLSKVTVKFAYKIKVINEGEIAGYAKEVKDHIPAGLKFVKEDNPKWYECEDGTVATAQLENTLLQPGETATVDIILTWINGNDNLGLKTNYAEISKDYNESNTPDIDSSTNNFKGKPVEDDEDEAPVVLSVKTGTAPMYITLTIVVLTILSSGIILIKKYVL